MGKFVIKRRVSLDFLGEEYKDSQLTFRAIPVVDYQEITKKIGEIGEDNTKSISYILEILSKYFIEGSVGGEEVKSEDLKELDVVTAIKCFEVLSGQVNDQEGNPIDPKGEAQ